MFVLYKPSQGMYCLGKCQTECQTWKKFHREVEYINNQSWAHCSLKSLNRSSLLSEPWFWEWWRSIRKRAKSDERTDKVQILSVRSWAISGKDSAVKRVEKRIKMHDFDRKVKFKDRKVKFFTKKLSFGPKS